MTSQEKIWKVIRGLSTFTVDDVAILTETRIQAVRPYLSLLHQSGYLRLVDKRNGLKGRRQHVYRLVKNSGVKAPILRKCLYDQNLDTLMEVKDVVGDS